MVQPVFVERGKRGGPVGKGKGPWPKKLSNKFLTKCFWGVVRDMAVSFQYKKNVIKKPV